jgi:hypothetical protein
MRYPNGNIQMIRTADFTIKPAPVRPIPPAIF